MLINQWIKPRQLWISGEVKHSFQKVIFLSAVFPHSIQDLSTTYALLYPHHELWSCGHVHPRINQYLETTFSVLCVIDTLVFVEGQRLNEFSSPLLDHLT